MKSKSNIFWGIIIIGIGIFVLGRILGFHFQIATAALNLIVGMALISYGVSKFFQKKWNFLPFFAFYIGFGFIFCASLTQIDLFMNQFNDITPWMLTGPAAILAVGSMLIMNNSAPQKPTRNEEYTYSSHNHEQPKSTTKNRFTDRMDRLNIKNLFTTNTTIATSKQFEGGVISNRFSEATLDLKQVELQQDGVLEIENLFGSLQIVAPRHMKIQIVVINNVFSTIKEYGQADEITGNNQLTINIDAKFSTVKIIRG